MKSNDIPGTEDARYLSSILLNKTINLATNSQATVIILPSTVPQEDRFMWCTRTSMWSLFTSLKFGYLHWHDLMDNQFHLASSEKLKHKSVCHLLCLYCLSKTPIYTIKIKLLNSDIVFRFI
jgi:hypothetical protein